MRSCYPDGKISVLLKLGFAVCVISRYPQARKMVTIGARADALPAFRPARILTAEVGHCLALTRNRARATYSEQCTARSLRTSYRRCPDVAFLLCA